MKSYLKIICIVFLLFSIVGGLLIPVPKLAILHETIRNLFYHVPMWFSMIAVLIASLYNSIKYLGKNEMHYDVLAEESAKDGIMFGVLVLFFFCFCALYS